ncbi:HAD family hydrolase [Kutzneria buriramensis]|uniref:Phosphoglycolate phosphatase-like HAD superfamily hydrolase n=1 Tax=Kutzneria buriramensis TaxID=1045776 RepID=A0A3E0G5M9_9PSEU|nr:HAD family hydrolase [Kutzneria buriramensis]REH18139.1 phosphoglycolate phosphatase-like HAD superfamily hydrolase [Kutzneria buriramensis]
MRIEHIVWDWNGTLFGDSVALIEATIEAFVAAGLPAVTRERYQRHHTQPIPLFYNRLAGRELSDAEQEVLARHFQDAYVRRRDSIPLTSDAVDALRRWQGTGRTQSLLSMYPHEELLLLVDKAGIGGFFAAVDGLQGTERGYKAPHLRRQLGKLGVNPSAVLLVGDSADDAAAARECGTQFRLYHAGADALHARGHFDELRGHIVDSLTEAVEAAARPA